MAGYSGTPLVKKLGIGEGMRVLVVSDPGHADALLDPLPAGARLLRAARGEVDLVLLFTTRRADLARRFPALAARLPPAGALWVAWPKRSSGVATDITEDVLREELLPTGWVDVKVCAVDDTWSGLRFVRRRSGRA